MSGIKKLKRAKSPIIKNIIKGLEKVKRKPFRIFLPSEIPSSSGFLRFRVGFDLNRYTPNPISTTDPMSCKMLWFRVRNSSMKERQKPVRRQYIISEIAAPIPVKNPVRRPFSKVRCTQRIPTGPIGADMMIPMAIPRQIIYIIPSMKFTISYRCRCSLQVNWVFPSGQLVIKYPWPVGMHL